MYLQARVREGGLESAEFLALAALVQSFVADCETLCGRQSTAFHLALQGQVRAGDVGSCGDCGELWVLWGAVWTVGTVGSCGGLQSCGDCGGQLWVLWGAVGTAGSCGELWGAVGSCGELWGAVDTVRCCVAGRALHSTWPSRDRPSRDR